MWREIHWFSAAFLRLPKISVRNHPWYPLIPRKLQLFQVKETRLQRVVYVRLCHFRMPYGCAWLCQMSQPISGADLRMAPFECHWRSPKPMVFQEPFWKEIASKVTVNCGEGVMSVATYIKLQFHGWLWLTVVSSKLLGDLACWVNNSAIIRSKINEVWWW